jgi:hypothetical protein
MEMLVWSGGDINVSVGGFSFGAILECILMAEAVV